MDAPLLTTWEDRGPGLVAVVYCHATYLFIYKLSYVVIMSVHNPALKTVFLWHLRVVKGTLYGIEPSTRNGNIWPTRERQHRQYLKISC